MPPTNYRRATLHDLDTLVDFRCRFIAEVSKQPIPDFLRQQIRKSLLDHMPADRFVSWFAEHDGAPIATGCLVYWDLLPTMHRPSGRKAYIMNMYTEPGYRRQGIAAELVKRLVAEVKSAGLSEVTLHALPAGLHVYEQLGFTITTDEMKLKW